MVKVLEATRSRESQRNFVSLDKILRFEVRLVATDARAHEDFKNPGLRETTEESSRFYPEKSRLLGFSGGIERPGKSHEVSRFP